MTLWHAKLAAWTHDPAEKALVLLRDPAGHEWGTVADLRERIFGQRDIPPTLKSIVERADHWAAAADRPQWPRDEKDGRYVQWARVRFTEKPILIHPLSGEDLELEKLSDIPVEHIKAVSRDHFSKLIDSEKNEKKTALAFWRFGPMLRKTNGQQPDELGEFWGLLPADTRIPDHTIWQHLDLTAAFATAFHADKNNNPALLAVSFGPVQEFIAQARTTSDLWAGSHLLSRIAWEGIKVVCTEYGPDAVLFPQLRGIPQVDLWLQNEMKLPKDWFKDEEWRKGTTDSNPLFAAALPNRFVVLVPASAATELAKCITTTVRDWVISKGNEALDKLLKRACISDTNVQEVYDQIKAQLTGFPEVHWTVVPWCPLIGDSGGVPDVTSLYGVLKTFHGEETSQGFLDSNAWKLLSRELTANGQRFYMPNAGVLYPALYDLLDRSQAAAKSVRTFRQLAQKGYRCSLCGEREWLTHDRELLNLPPGKRREAGSLWWKLQDTSWARKGEHLCALCTLKRLWPNLYCDETAEALNIHLTRFVVSTHTMALATSLERWLEQQNRKRLPERWLSQLEPLSRQRTVALPRKLAKRLLDDDPNIRAMLRGLPLFLEDRDEESQSDESDDRDKTEMLTRELDCELKKVLGHKPEAYYAMILMDGDRMGAWLSGQGEDGERYRLPFECAWHPQLRTRLRGRHAKDDLATYLSEKRPVSPARHMAISSSLNGFALHIARYIIEDVGKGKLIYAGGDDVLAMVSVDDLLAIMFLLRLAYSGISPIEYEDKLQLEKLTGLSSSRFDLRRGYVTLDDKLYRMMGNRATASAGAVVAHHKAPLGFVLRKLREAEQRAKKDGGRDAFAISLLKRSSGATQLICPWFMPQLSKLAGGQKAMHNPEETPMGQLILLRDRFASQTFSRRAAYLTQGWLTETPESALSAMLGYQFKQQTIGDEADKQDAESVGKTIGELAIAINASSSGRETESGYHRRELRLRSFIEDFLAVAEFLAREGRTKAPVTRE